MNMPLPVQLAELLSSEYPLIQEHTIELLLLMFKPHNCSHSLLVGQVALGSAVM